MADIVPIQRQGGSFIRQKRNKVSRVLKEARGCEEVLVIGVRDGELHLRGCPNSPGDAMWLMELAKKKLLGLG